MSNELAVVYLEAAAAQAKALAEDAKRSRLWEGDLSRRIGEVRENLDKAAREAAERS